MKLFNELGQRIEDLWRERDYDEEVFPALAADALRRADLPSKVSAWEIVEWTLKQSELPRQKDPRANFGEPPITLFVGPRFYLDVYIWLEGTTAIHQHGFCGAFQVLMGSSIHSWYEFKLREKINVFVELGDIDLKLCQLLKVGDVHEILPGRQYVHSLFHLDQPSVTVVARTDKSPLYLPQFNYNKPSLAVDPFYEHETTTRKLQIIGALFRAKNPDVDRMITELLERSDFHTSFLILDAARNWLQGDHIGQLFGTTAPGERFKALLAKVCERHGERGEALAQVFERLEMVNEIVKRRSVVTDPEHRFFLALLLNLDGRQNICRLVAQRYPDMDPVEKILDWTLDLSQTRAVGMNIQNALGIQDLDSLDLQVFEYLLRGVDDADIPAKLREEVGEAQAEEVVAKLETSLRKLREAVIFKPLFARESNLI